jgi:hypothetical protein
VSSCSSDGEGDDDYLQLFWLYLYILSKSCSRIFLAKKDMNTFPLSDCQGDMNYERNRLRSMHFDLLIGL